MRFRGLPEKRPQIAAEQSFTRLKASVPQPIPQIKIYKKPKNPSKSELIIHARFVEYMYSYLYLRKQLSVVVLNPLTHMKIIFVRIQAVSSNIEF